MKLHSGDTSPARGAFHDLHSFKDFVGMVTLCAPAQFLYLDWLGPHEQWNLDRAFEGLRYGLTLTAREKGDSALLAKCRELVELSYGEYKAGRNRAGRAKLVEMEKLLMKLPSQ